MVLSVTREKSAAPVLLMVAGFLLGMAGFALQPTVWHGLGLPVQVLGGLFAIAGVLLLARR